MRRHFTGLGTALITPFRIEAGVHFLSPCGTTGEAPTLSEQEKVRVVELVAAEANGKVPVLAGAGGYDTREVVHMVRRMEEAGANGILSVTPYYNKPTPEGLYHHYKVVAESTSLPIVLYNVPGRTGVNVDPQTLLRISELKNIVAVKEASGNMTQMCEICAAVRDDFIVLSGDDALALPLMAVGGHGVVSVASNEAPAEMAQMVEAAEKGDIRGASRLHTSLLPLMQVNFVESNPGPVKAAMAAMGLIEENYRLPMVSPRPASREKIVRVLQELKLLGTAARV